MFLNVEKSYFFLGYNFFNANDILALLVNSEKIAILLVFIKYNNASIYYTKTLIYVISNRLKKIQQLVASILSVSFRTAVIKKIMRTKYTFTTV